MTHICPYFKENKCISKYYSDLDLKVSAIAICATEEHVKCPFYIRTVEGKKKEEKEARK